MKLGVQSVILVNSEHRVSENFHKLIGKELYYHLMNGDTINEAYRKTLKEMEAKKVCKKTCCCLHQHSKGCKWLKILHKEGLEAAHSLHEQSCDCPKRNFCNHLFDCPLSKKLISKMDYKIAILEEHPTQQTICCCKPHISHDTSLCFQIFYKHRSSEKGENRPFSEIDKGDPVFAKDIPFKEPEFKGLLSVGLEKPIYQLYNSFITNGKRMIFLLGELGSGKRYLSKKLSNVFSERKAITDIKRINMNKINNLNVFMSRLSRSTNIFSQQNYIDYIPQNSNTLVILENLNYLLETNREEFMNTMLTILEKSKLKFLVISGLSNELLQKGFFSAPFRQAIDEIYHMPSISAQKASRVLQIITNNDILRQEGLSLRDLMVHPLLRIHAGGKLHFKKLFDIRYRLKRKESLSEITASLETQDAQNKVYSQEQVFQELVALTTEVKNMFPEYFGLLCFLTMFSSGLGVSDLRDAAYILGMKDIWVETVIIFSKELCRNSLLDTIQTYQAEVRDRLENNEKDSDVFRNLVHYKIFIEDENAFLKIQQENTSSLGNVSIQGTDVLKQMISLTEDDDGFYVFKNLTQALSYYKNFCDVIIRLKKPQVISQESILSASAFSENPLWCISEPTSSASDFKSYISGLSQTRIEELLMFHESNIRALVTNIDAYSIYGGLRYVARIVNLQSSFFILLEEFIIKLLSVYSQICSFDVANQMIAHVREILEDAEDLNIHLTRVDIKVELMTLANTCKKISSFSPNKLKKTDFTHINQRVKVVEEMIECYDHPDSILFRLQLLLTKYKLFQFYKNRNFSAAAKIDNVIIELKSCIQQVPANSREKGKILLAKSVFILNEYRVKNNVNSVSYDISVHHLQESFAIFKEFKMDNLTMRTSELLLRFDSLSRHEKMVIAEEGLTCARLIQNKEKEEVFGRYIQEQQTEYKGLDSNKIIFMNNIVQENEGTSDCLMTFTKEMREIIKDDLRKTNKNVFVQFTNYSEDELEHLLMHTRGCKICTIDVPLQASNPWQKDSVSTSDFMTDPSESQSLNSYSTNPPFSSSGRKMSIDSNRQPIEVLLLLGELKSHRASQIISKSAIPWTISLSFKGVIKSRLDLLGIWLSSEFKYSFLKRFIKSMINRYDFKKVRSPLEIAEETRESTIKELKTKLQQYRIVYMNELDATEVDSLFFEGENIDLNDIFSKCLVIKENPLCQPVSQPYQFKVGSIEELESVYSRKELFKLYREPLARPETVSKMLKTLNSWPVVNLCGTKGIGKSTFILHFLNQVIARELFKDGVYLFSLEKFARECPNGNIKDLMKQQLGNLFDTNYDLFFKNKQMLIAFDDFHVITNKHELIFPIHLIKSLLKNKIKVILISKSKICSEEYIDSMKSFRLHRLRPEESLMLYLYSQDNLLLRFDDLKFGEMLDSKILASSRGVPAKIYQHSLDFLHKVIQFRMSSYEDSEHPHKKEALSDKSRCRTPPKEPDEGSGQDTRAMSEFYPRRQPRGQNVNRGLEYCIKEKDSHRRAFKRKIEWSAKVQRRRRGRQNFG